MKRATTLFFREGSADKQYTATLDGQFIQCAWGRRGGTMQTKTYGPFPEAKAEQFWADKVSEKTGKGYAPGADAAPIVDPAFVQGAQSNLDYELAAAWRPMLLNEVSDAELIAIVYDARYILERKHDGVRCILHFDGTDTRGFSRTKKEIAITKPIADAAKKFMGTFILDGEKVGDIFWAFDVLSLNGRDLRSEPLARRKTILHGAFPYSQSAACSGGIVIVESISEADAKLAAIGHAKADGAEGIVLKDLDSAYLAGRPNSGGFWLKYKFVATASVIVAPRAANSRKAGKSSVDMMLYDGTPLGSVTIAGANVLAPEPNQIIEVRYLYAMRAGSLVQPCFLGVRSDIPPEDCTIDQLQFKGEGESE
jgi:bifunctional non-homologous end joining protein LigD